MRRIHSRKEDNRYCIFLETGGEVYVFVFTEENSVELVARLAGYAVDSRLLFDESDFLVVAVRVRDMVDYGFYCTLGD